MIILEVSIVSDIDTEELKAYAPIVPYIQKHYGDKIQIKK